MRELKLQTRSNAPLKVLCLGAHCDDIEIGCGGTILKLTQKYPDSQIYWVVLSSNIEREIEANESANLFLENVIDKEVIIKNFRNGFFPYIGMQIKEYFEQLKMAINPDIIFTHYRNDLHQDHRFISEVTWNTFRDHLILEYEIIKYDGDIGVPNCYSSLSAELVEKKVEILCGVFKSQLNKPWFSEETFRSILRLRGVECNSKNDYAEAFYYRKVLIDF